MRAQTIAVTRTRPEDRAAGHTKVHLSCTLSPVELESWVEDWEGLLIEFRHIDQQIKIEREERSQ
jgi:hypothetical protein